MAKEKQEGGFDILMFQRLWKILKILFPKWFSIPTSLFFLLLITSILEQYVGYKVGLISSTYYKVLGDRDLSGFFSVTLRSLGLVLVMALVITSKTYVANMLYVIWRQSLCQSVHHLYFSGINYYTLNVLGKNLDNPDQRMTQDIDTLCKSLSTISVTVIISPFKIGYYTYKTYLGTDWIGPVGVFSFFVVGTVLNKLVMSPIVKYYMAQEKREGDFRFKHMHVRVNSESVAFYVSGPLELCKTNYALNKLIKAQQVVFNRQFWLNLIQNTYDYMGSIVSYCVIAIPIFNGAYDDIDGSDLSSLISKNSFLCMTLMYSFSQLVDLTSSVVALSGVTHRVSQLVEKLNDLQEEWDLQELQISSSYSSLMQNQPSLGLIKRDLVGDRRSLLIEDTFRNLQTIESRDETPIQIAFIFQDVTISTPDTERILIKGLDLEIRKGQNLLVMGPSSCGKSSLLRIMRGLWAANHGTVAHNLTLSPKTVIFLPQKPLLTSGSLFEQIIYPLCLDSNHPPNDDVCNKIIECINKLLLHGLIQRSGGLLNDPQWNWDDVLSPGEMQRVCFLRVLYHRPQFAFLDEATSALSFEVEDLLYSMCLDLGITIISVGHRHSLIKYHHLLLDMKGDSTWEIKEINNAANTCDVEEVKDDVDINTAL